MEDSKEPWKREEEEEEEELDDIVSASAQTIRKSNIFLELHRAERCCPLRD